MTVKVLHNQSLLDLAIQHTGSVANAFAIAVANNISVTSFLIAGTELLIPENVLKDEDILNFYNSKQIKPATGTVKTPLPIERGGIGYMQIRSTFKVS